MTGSELFCGNYDYAIATETDTSIQMRKNEEKNVLEIHRLGARARNKKWRNRKFNEDNFYMIVQADKRQASKVSAIMIEV